MKEKLFVSLVASAQLVAPSFAQPASAAIEESLLLQNNSSENINESEDRLDLADQIDTDASDFDFQDEVLRRDPRRGGPGRSGVRGGRPGRGGPGRAGPRRGHGRWDGRARHHARPPAWRWHRNWSPRWWVSAPFYPIWGWAWNVGRGNFQCIAVNRFGDEFYGWGRDLDDAAHSALYSCGSGSRYMYDNCFIPQGYCRIR